MSLYRFRERTGTLNLRGRIACEWTYFDTGRYIVQAFIQLVLFPIAIAKYLGLPLWLSLFVAPLAVGSSILIGRFHNHFGWAKQSSEIGLIEQMSWQAYVDKVHQWRVYEALAQLTFERPGLASMAPYTDIPGEMPQAIRDVMKSYTRAPSPRRERS